MGSAYLKSVHTILIQTLLLWTSISLFFMGEILYASSMVGLYAMGILQLALSWFMYKKNENAILLSYVVAILALVFSIGVDIYWLLSSSAWLTPYFIPIIPIEVILMICLFRAQG